MLRLVAMDVMTSQPSSSEGLSMVCAMRPELGLKRSPKNWSDQDGANFTLTGVYILVDENPQLVGVEVVTRVTF